MYNAPVPPPSELPTPRALLRSTAIAVAVAALLLVTVVLPAEYGVDLTGIGRPLGLTRMGEIKVALAREAEADAAADSAAAAASERAGDVSVVPTPGGITIVPGEAPASQLQLGAKTDSVAVLLEPGQGREFKLVMTRGAQVRYEWATDWGVVNFDLHADGTNAAAGSTTRYAQGTVRAADQGVLTAAFDGLHGWFWRNRGTEAVTVTLRVSGDYSELREIK
jgi:hypothetical protein